MKGINYRYFGLKRIDTYILKKFLGTYFFSLVLILSVSIVFDFTEKVDKFYDNNAPLDAIIFDYYLNFIPYYMNTFSSLFVFISVIFFTSKMAMNSEIIAILSSGISFRRLMFPYFLSALFIASLSFCLGAYVIPRSSEIMLEFENLYVRKSKKETVRDIQMEVEKGLILYVENFQEKTNTGRNFSLEKFDGKHLVSRITAESIRWDSAYHWTINKYLKRDFDGMYESISMGEKLDTILQVHPRDFFIMGEDAAKMRNPELARYINRQRDRGVGNIQIFEDEYYRRFAMPFAAFVMTLLGVSLSSRKARGGMGLNLGLGLGLSGLFVLFQTTSTSFSVSGTMSSFSAVWLPNFLFLMVGIFLYLRVQK